MRKQMIYRIFTIMLVCLMISSSLARNLQQGPRPGPPLPQPQTQRQPQTQPQIQSQSVQEQLQRRALNWNSLNFARSYDGSGHNEQNNDWGKLNYTLRRRGAHSYDSEPQPFSRPNPRVISNVIGSEGSEVPSSRKNLSILFTMFGQFIDHDFASQPTQKDGQTANIVIPEDDLFFTPGSEIAFKRSVFTLDDNGVRQHMSALSPWIDGGGIYGSTVQIALSLRELSNGKMKTTQQGSLLPQNEAGFFLAGDGRVNQNGILTAIHTIFVKYHNLICERIISDDPTLQNNDQAVYTIARNYVVGVLQNIVYNEWLKELLGPNGLPKYNGYNENINPDLDIEFTTAAFRFGHTLLKDQISRINKQGEVVQNYNLQDLFANPTQVDSAFISQILRGASMTHAKERSVKVIDDIRNFLTFTAGGEIKTDLFSLNLQRGRDNGIPTYGQMRRDLNLPPVNPNFINFTKDRQVNRKLRQIYGSPDNMDLWLGILGEPSEPSRRNNLLGQVGQRIIEENFRRIRDGDRLWFQNSEVYPRAFINEIKKTKLFDVIKQVTDFNGVNQVLPDKNLFKV